MVFGQVALLAFAILPFALAQTSTNFESGWDQTAWPIYAPDCNQGGTVTLDSTTAHSGTNSLKVTSPGGYCGHIFFGTTAVPTGDVYVRVWLKATNALTANHVSFITMPDSAQGAGKHLRIGGQDQVLMYNRESDDATLPDMSPQGVATSEALPTGVWECFEYHLGTDGSIQTWLNSNAIAGLTTAGNLNDNGWKGSSIIPKITGVYFGWESYGGDVNTFVRIICSSFSPLEIPVTAPILSQYVLPIFSRAHEISSFLLNYACQELANSLTFQWYDDVAVSSSRVGCSVGGSSPSSTPATTLSTSVKTGTASSTVKISTTSSAVKTSTTTSSAKTSSTAVVGTVPLYGQCGGIGWTGGTVCASGTCTSYGSYYSQCVPS
ncbi:Glucuronoyl esterase [Hyphodiscus hymeniophilus]|uniref:Glucuronoyl esterase n=1 Tax=Hyphodiscus hymeniophilus TaxID=353542 RepID=A0A9P6VRV5_9HELO|nr:Glucuronoyl esterase [Hyphodiscus hymeniophilus]